MKKWLLIAVAVVLLAIGAAVYIALSSIDSLVVTGVEKFGSDITQTQVRLNEAKITLSSGRGTLRELSVGNPKGFSDGTSFRLGEITVEIDTSTIAQNPVVIKKIVIDGPVVYYEIGPQGTNIQAIQQNINQYTGGGGGPANEPASPQKEDSDTWKFVIQDLYIRNGRVQVSATLFPEKKRSASLPDIHLQNIGKGGGGASPGEIAQVFIGALRQTTSQAVSSLGVNRVIERTTKGLGEVSKKASDALKKLFGK